MEKSISIAHFDGEPVTMLDTLASKARTALDDPGAIDLRFESLPALRESYAIERLDEIIGALNPAELTRENAADALTVLGRHVAEIVDRLGEIEDGALDAEADAIVRAENYVHAALDRLDEAIVELRPEPEDDAWRQRYSDPEHLAKIEARAQFEREAREESER